ncbi:MAG: hypothetical protein HZA46_19875 [Planctomycetales bacterium]|nr:hypothetical protein [Planctomycetales bacterium]
MLDSKVNVAGQQTASLKSLDPSKAKNSFSATPVHAALRSVSDLPSHILKQSHEDSPAALLFDISDHR